MFALPLKIQTSIFPLKDLSFRISFKNLSIHIVIGREKSSLQLTQCRINKSNTEQKKLILVYAQTRKIRPLDNKVITGLASHF